MLSNQEEYQKMNSTESELWWYKVLHEKVLDVIRKRESSKDIAILDAACGTGGLMKSLIQQGFSNIQGFDISPYAVALAHRKTGKEILQLDLTEVNKSYASHTFDVVICNDALYFIDERELPKVLAALFSLLKENGVLMINLPAFQVFKGMHDVSVAIHKRWTFGKFCKIAAPAFSGRVEVQHAYWPFLLSPLILAVRLYQRLKLKLNPNIEVVSDVQLPSMVLNKIFYNLTKWESYLPFRKWIGSSLFIVIHR